MSRRILSSATVCWSLWCLYFTSVTCHRRAKSTERRLFEHLMKDYDAASRPVMNAADTVNVNLSISLNKIHDLVEKNQTLITHVWIFEEWIDEMLRWNPRRFDGLQTIVIPTGRIWLPDIYIYNNADKGSEGFVTSSDSHVIVDYKGRVSWTVPLITKSSCSVDVRYFPFDNQHCFVKFGSWIYEESQLDLKLKIDEVDLSPPFSENNELDLLSAKLSREVVEYDLMKGRYAQVTMFISVRRRPVFYAYTVIAPTLVLCILTLFSFLLPCDNGDKVGIGLTVFLSLYVLQLAIAENVPEANSLPLVGLFLTLVMTLNAISLVFATLVINIKKKGDRPNCPCVPNLVLTFCRKVLARITCTPFINFYEFYGFCELESQTARETLPDPRQSAAAYPSFGNCETAEPSRGGIASFRPRAKRQTASAGATGVKKRHVTVGTRPSVDGATTSRAKDAKTAQNPPRDPKYEWFFVAEVLDKSLFLLFLVAMLCTIIISLIVIPWIHRND